MTALGGLLLMQATGAAAIFNAPPVPDEVLATERGGVRLPNGIDLALTVQSQTAVDGAVVLHTVLMVDESAPTVMVYVPREGTSVPALPQPTDAGSGNALPPAVSVDSRNGIQVTPGTSFPPIRFSHSPTQGGGSVPDGLEAVDPTTPVQTGNGTVSTNAGGGLRSIELIGSDYSITHLVGNAFGSIIANSGSDRTIDTETTVSIDLHNAGPDVIGSTMFRVENIAIDAVSSRF